ncbi:MAG: hypothetical protein ACI8PZ_004974 [Myxococcota bacterium]|jgi:hypothetical protein
MLLRFSVENFRSFRQEAEFSFVATRITDSPTHVFPASTPEVDHGVLPALAVYGANASGKSNGLRALAVLRNEVKDSFSERKPGDRIAGYKPFLLGTSDEARPTTWTIDFLVEGVRYHYGLSINATEVVEEWLDAYPERRRQQWFHRTVDASAERPTFYFGPGLKGRRQAIADFTRPNATFLSAAAQNAHEQLTPVYTWFSESIRISSGLQGRGVPRFSRQEPIAQEGLRSLFQKLLREADVGIEDFRIVDDEREVHTARQVIASPDLPDEGRTSFARFERELLDNPPVYPELLHRGEGGKPRALDLDDESHGTKMLLLQTNHALSVLSGGGLLVVDEIDASLHTRLAERLIGLFTDPQSNPNGAQLLFASHNPALLDSLRRDEVVFTEKGRDGGSTVVPLSDYNTRKRLDTGRAYREGRLGGVPVLGDLAAVVADELHRGDR